MREIDYDFFKNYDIPHFSHYIYHYTSPTGLYGILNSNSLWFTNIYFLNDKSERFYTHRLILKILPELKSKIDSRLYEILEGYSEYVTSQDFLKREKEVLAREEFYIASFSKDQDNLALWNCYTKNNDKAGYNIKFTSEKLVNNLKEQLSDRYVQGSLVCYDVDKQKDALIGCINKYNEKFINEDNIVGLDRDLLYEIIVYSLFFKHPKFSVEKEYRIIVSNTAHIQDKDLDFVIKDGLFIPHLICKFSDLTDVEHRIIEGIKMSSVSNSNLAAYSLEKLINKTKYYFIEKSESEIPL